MCMVVYGDLTEITLASRENSIYLNFLVDVSLELSFNVVTLLCLLFLSGPAITFVVGMLYTEKYTNKMGERDERTTNLQH